MGLTQMSSRMAPTHAATHDAADSTATHASTTLTQMSSRMAPTHAATHAATHDAADSTATHAATHAATHDAADSTATHVLTADDCQDMMLCHDGQNTYCAATCPQTSF